jgi:hypothetical protein
MRGIEMNVKGSVYEGREVGSVGSNPTFSAERFSLNTSDSLNKRVIRHLNYHRWIPSYIEPLQYLAFKIKIKRKYFKRISTVNVMLEIDKKVINQYILKKDIKARCYSRVYGKML